jgi:hypothetical protein
MRSKADADALIAGLNPATANQYAAPVFLRQSGPAAVRLVLRRVGRCEQPGSRAQELLRLPRLVGTREWSILPWDTDLTWGRNWLDAGGYFNRHDLHQQRAQSHPGYNDGGTQSSVQNKGTMNRLYQVMFDSPDFRKMYLGGCGR